jgi:outer membrane lipoprotein-sorting protein
MREPSAWALMAACALLGLRATEPTLAAADDVMQRSRAMYQALHSYADTGVVLKEYGTSTKDRHTFTTSFNRSPRRFVLDFHIQGGDQFVVWGDPDAFHKWSKVTGQQFDYPNPDNIGAFNSSGYNTYSTVSKVPTLLYGKAPLLSDFANFADLEDGGAETIDGHRCLRVLGTSRDVYAATGKEVNVRKMTVWIDADSLLIRKVLEEWKPLPGQISRVTTTYSPQANPTIDDTRLRFTPLAAR